MSPRTAVDGSTGGFVLKLDHPQAFAFREITFLSQPIFHRVPQAIERDAMSCLHQPVGYGECVVEDRVVGEVPHGKAVQTFDGAPSYGAIRCNDLDLKFALKHGLNEQHEHWCVGSHCLHRTAELSGAGIVGEDGYSRPILICG